MRRKSLIGLAAIALAGFAYAAPLTITCPALDAVKVLKVDSWYLWTGTASTNKGPTLALVGEGPIKTNQHLSAMTVDRGSEKAIQCAYSQSNTPNPDTDFGSKAGYIADDTSFSSCHLNRVDRPGLTDVCYTIHGPCKVVCADLAHPHA